MSESKRSTSNTKGKRKDAPGSKKGRKSSKRQKKKQEEKHEGETKAETTAPPGIARAVHQAVDGQLNRDDEKRSEEIKAALFHNFAEEIVMSLVRNRLRDRHGAPNAELAHAIKWIIATVVRHMEKDASTTKRIIAFSVDGKIVSTEAFATSLGPDPDPKYINHTTDACARKLMADVIATITKDTQVCVMCIDQLEMYGGDGNYVHYCPLKLRDRIDVVLWERFGKDLSLPGRVNVGNETVVR